MTGSHGSDPRFPMFRPNKDGSPWYLRVFRITTVRIVSQATFFGLFIFLLWVTWFSRLGGYPVSLFLEVDPLVGFATALSTGTVYRWLWRGLFVLIPTLLLGRVFCNWMCPYGTLHQFFGWIFNTRANKDNIDRNRYRGAFQIKYVILTMMLVMAAFGVLQIGLLDPICLLVRTMTVAVAPAVDLSASMVADYAGRQGLDAGALRIFSSAPGAPEQRVFAGAWFVGLMILGLVGMNLVIPRFFCRVLCPLGAFLGVLSRFSLWRIDRDLTKCTDCDLCLKHCEGAADPQAALRKSECFVCFNCIDDCPEDALSFRLAPPTWKDRITGEKDRLLGRIKEGTATLRGRKVISRRWDTEKAAPAMPRRRWVFSVIGGVLAAPFVRLSAAVNARAFSEKAIRPPGTVEEGEFLERCIKCDQCINVCPTNVLQPSHPRPGRFRGTVDAGHGFPGGSVPAQLYALFGGLPHRRHPEDLAGAQAGAGRVHGAGAHQAGHRLLRPRAMPPLGDGDAVRRVRRSVPGEPQGHRHVRRGDHALGRHEGDAEPSLHAPGALHRLRDLRAGVPRRG